MILGCLAAAVLIAGGLARAAPPILAASAAVVAGDTIRFVAQTGDAYEIHEIGADGSGEKVVRALPPSFSLDSRAEWSPTGAAVAFNGVQNNVFMMLVMRINDGRTTPIARHVGSVAWSPDGRQLAYIVRGRGLQIFIVNADGTRRRRIVAAPARALSGVRSGAAFSPDGKAVVSVSYWALAWSPDKRSLVYERSVSYDSRHPPVSARLFLISADGKRSRKLPRLRPFVAGVLAWSPNSASIAVGSWTDLGVMTVNTRRNTKKYVTKCCSGVHDLAWSRDGKTIVLFSDASAGPAGAIVNADGSQLRLLRVGGDHPAWSPDSKRIAFDHGRTLHIVNANGSGLRTLTEGQFPIWR